MPRLIFLTQRDQFPLLSKFIDEEIKAYASLPKELKRIWFGERKMQVRLITKSMFFTDAICLPLEYNCVALLSEES